MPYEKKHNTNEKQEQKSSGNKKKSPNAYTASKERWDSENKWLGSKVTLWMNPQRAKALWHYGKINRLPAMPTEALYHLIDAIGDQGTFKNVAEASPPLNRSSVAVLQERLDRLEASNNEALTAISTLLLEILGELRTEIEEPKTVHPQAPERSIVQGTGIPIRQWLDSLSGSEPKNKAVVVIASLVLPKSVTLSEGVSVCQISALQVNGIRASTPKEHVSMPSLAVHTAVKKEPSGSNLLIARLKANTWSIELAAVSADGKQKSTLSTFEM